MSERRHSTVADSGYADLSRRRFLQATGFTFMGALVYGCARAPEEELLPLLEQPEGMIPGRADYYATTCGGCAAGCGILAKSRDGRPIKLEGNPDHPLSKGGLCAVGQASLLGLYDSRRFQSPSINGATSTWTEVDSQLEKRFTDLGRRGARVRYLSAAITSPTKKNAIDVFLGGFSDGRHVVYEPATNAAILDAYERTHGRRVCPHHRFDRSRLTVSFDADFLGGWISPMEFTRDYSDARRPEGEGHGVARHVQFESRLSLTGAKASQRHRIAPSEHVVVLSQLAAAVASHAGRRSPTETQPSEGLDPRLIDRLADDLWANRGQSLVVCGADDVSAHVLCNYINDLLGNYGHTLDLGRPSIQTQGDDAQLHDLLEDLESGNIDALLVDGVNPLLELSAADGSPLDLGSVPLVISLAPRANESTAAAHYICPDSHFLESWGDSEPVLGTVGTTQPLVRPLADTRQAIESLAQWSGSPRSARAQLQERWGSGRQWNQLVHDGFRSVDSDAPSAGSFRPQSLSTVSANPRPAGDAFQLVLYSKIGMPTSAYAYNPWLQELPDPISKSVWDNYACLSPQAAEDLGVATGDVVELAVSGGGTIEAPVLVQEGQHDHVVAIALGYGAVASQRFADVGPDWIERQPTVGPSGLVGVSATSLIGRSQKRRSFSGATVALRATGRTHPIARTQDYQSIEVPEHLAPAGGRRRSNIQETTLALLAAPEPQHHSLHHEGDLWPDDHEYKGHHWGMAIDLNACTGCAGCVVACQVENNVPVVGKDEVARSREMHWIRIDRYFAGSGDNLTIAHQPMMCHQCDNAPCETVCPVLATVHSDEGLNEQIYNRCVGTRYCLNNCPYKVRRFNWFEYAHEDAHENLALNPDVTVRSRGVMEKCSFCVQRIHDAKAEARRGRRELEDGDIQVACQQSCPAQAIVFGDMNDSESEIAATMAKRRHYRVLEEINVRPTVGYLELVRDRTLDEGPAHHGE
jgi:Fe-S-cluster-containing dehydrogenase component